MPETIEASQAREHVGSLVVVETPVAAARVERGQAVLEPAGEGPQGLSIVIAPPLLGPSAAELSEKFAGREVSAIGYISDFGGRLELLIGDPDRVRLVADERAAEAATDAEPAVVEVEAVAVVEVEAVAVVDERPAPAAATSQKTPSPARPSTESVAVVPAAAVAAAGAAPRTTSETAAAPGREQAAADRACAAARRSWREAVAAARVPLHELLRCFDAGEPRCTATATRARIALAEVAAGEERLRWVCGGVR